MSLAIKEHFCYALDNLKNAMVAFSAFASILCLDRHSMCTQHGIDGRLTG